MIAKAEFLAVKTCSGGWFIQSDSVEILFFRHILA